MRFILVSLCWFISYFSFGQTNERNIRRKIDTIGVIKLKGFSYETGDRLRLTCKKGSFYISMEDSLLSTYDNKYIKVKGVLYHDIVFLPENDLSDTEPSIYVVIPDKISKWRIGGIVNKVSPFYPIPEIKAIEYSVVKESEPSLDSTKSHSSYGLNYLIVVEKERRKRTDYRLYKYESYEFIPVKFDKIQSICNINTEEETICTSTNDDLGGFSIDDNYKECENFIIVNDSISLKLDVSSFLTY